MTHAHLRRGILRPESWPLSSEEEEEEEEDLFVFNDTVEGPRAPSRGKGVAGLGKEMQRRERERGGLHVPSETSLLCGKRHLCRRPEFPRKQPRL